MPQRGIDCSPWLLAGQGTWYTYQVRSQPLLLLDDPDPNFRLHVSMELDRYAIDAECLDWLVQVDEALFDVEALRGELLRDVR